MSETTERPPEHRRRRRRRHLRLSRDGMLFACGLAGLVYETAVHQGETRDILVLAFLAMTGVPAFLRIDESRQEREK